jgi:SAM-dependent methyltransferase
VNPERSSAFLEEASCDVCGPAMVRHTFYLDDRITGERFKYNECRQCGTIFVNPRPSAKGISSYYPDTYEPYRLGTDGQILTEDRDAISGLNIQLDYIERFQHHRGYLLDIGCASGAFLNQARNRGWEVMGVEPIQKAAEAARDKYNLTIYQDLSDISRVPPDGFDAITLWDVLEHLPSPRKILEKCQELLKPGGSLFISIPNLACFDRRIFRFKWIGWDPPRHFYLFSSSSLQRLLLETGFEVFNHQCIIGGKGTFFMSLDLLVKDTSLTRPLQKIYPAISLILWPYRKISYLLMRGPIITVCAGRVSKRS